MSLIGRAFGWLAPAPSPAAPRRPQGPEDRWSRSASFSITLPPEMTGDLTSPRAVAPRVSREQAIQVPAVKRVRDLICGTLGTLDLCQLSVPGFKEVHSPLLEQPEDAIARSVTMTYTIEDMLFEGRAWWRIVSFGPDGFPERVVRLEADSVTVRKNGKVWTNDRTLQAQGVSIGYQPDALLIRIDSPNDPLLIAGARAIRTALALNSAADRYAEDPQPVGYVTPKGDVDLDPDFDADEMLDDMEDSRARRSWGYIGAGVELHQMSFTPEQLQFMTQRDYAVLEIARIGGVDPEELGVSTTSRTYANAEQRRLDLIDFTCAAYVKAVQDRLSMNDVTQAGRKVYFDYDAFLRSDTPSRMDVYEKGRKVGAYDDERIARAERIPVARVRKAMESAKQPTPAPAPQAPPTDQQPTEETVTNALAPSGVRFSAPAGELQLTFELPADAVQFKADSAKRTISGLALPWNVVARSGGYKWAFAPGSLHWSAPERVKLDKDHGYGTEFGKATTLTSTEVGLHSAFKVARGTSGDDALLAAEDGVYDGLSVYVNFETEGDGWIPHPDDETVRYVQSATLRKVALTAMPAFDDARVQHVAATRNGVPMQCTTCGKEHASGVACTATPTPANHPVPAAQFDAAAFTEHFVAGLTSALTEANKAMLADLIENLPAPQRQTVPAGGRLQSVREPLVYSMNGQGPSFVRDARKVMVGTDPTGEARARLRKFEAQTAELVEESMADPTFAISTGNAGAVIPPGYRPDLYVTQLLRGRPLTNAVSRGTIADATPFTVPAFVSATGATADHVEGVNPSEGSLVVAPITITPAGISGLYKITREMADSANPAIDAIANQAMSESFSQQTEAKVYAELNGTNGVGGVITSGFVPSGAQAVDVGGDISDGTTGRVFLQAIRNAIGVYDFRRFAEIDFGFLSQAGVTEFSNAVDTTGRPLVPWVNSMNPMGTMSQRGYDVDGVIMQKAWSMSGNAAGDADAIMGNRNDVWVWESPVLSFRFEERSGPAFIELALFGYFAVRVLRPVGLSGVRNNPVA